MKNQYACDINDFKKLGLIRIIADATKLRLIVNWMLTSDDKKSDGKFIEYLSKGGQLACCDSELFAKLKALVSGNDRSVSAIEKAELIPNAHYYDKPVPDGIVQREEWFEGLLSIVTGSELVFFDPDNGLQTKHKKKGHKESSKFVYWDEIGAIWELGCDILIYQHFPRKNRIEFIAEKNREVHSMLHDSSVVSFQTSNVLFILATHKDKWRKWDRQITTRCVDDWNGHIQIHRD